MTWDWPYANLYGTDYTTLTPVLTFHRSCRSSSMRRTWRVCHCSSLPINKTWPRPPLPVRSQRASTCTRTGTESGRSRPVLPYLEKVYRFVYIICISFLLKNLNLYNHLHLLYIIKIFYIIILSHNIFF